VVRLTEEPHELSIHVRRRREADAVEELAAADLDRPPEPPGVQLAADREEKDEMAVSNLAGGEVKTILEVDLRAHRTDSDAPEAGDALAKRLEEPTHRG
jgi:hypothetical protein